MLRNQQTTLCEGFLDARRVSDLIDRYECGQIATAEIEKLYRVITVASGLSRLRTGI